MKKLSIFLTALSLVGIALVGCGKKSPVTRQVGSVERDTILGVPCCVYLPYAYAERAAAQEVFPVLYLHHGMFGNENDWPTQGNLIAIMDSLLQRDLVKEMVVIMPDNCPGKPTYEEERANGMSGNWEASFPDFMAETEGRYSVSDQPSQRAIAGLSMGGFHTMHVSHHLHGQFDYIGLFSAVILPPELVGPYMNWESETREAIESASVYWIGMGREDFLFDQLQDFRRWLDKNHLAYSYYQSEGGHEWPNWQDYLGRFLPLCFNSAEKPVRSVNSPDGRTELSFDLQKDGQLTYSVSKNGHKVILPSRLGFILQNADLSHGFQLVSTKENSHDETWETVWGEERMIRDHHNELLLHLNHESGLRMDLQCRVFNDGFAFRYFFPEQDCDSLIILREETAYRFAKEPEVWSIPWRTEYYEALWHKTPMHATDTACSPVTLEMADGTYAFMHEAALTDYPAQNFLFDGRNAGTMLTPWQNGIAAYEKAPFSTPWRFVILADNLQEMMASRIMLNLNEPCALENTDWIKPMKFIGIWWGMHMKTMTWEMGPIHGATTANMTRYLDFAAANGFGGVLAEGWNLGWEDWSHFDFTTPYPDWDMKQLSRHAAQVGVQIVGHNETGGNAADYEMVLDTAYRYHNQHGIHVIKTGYVSPIIRTLDGLQYNRSQSGVRHYRNVIETAAKYQICIDNHEPVMPTGLQRTYPNLLTQEGVRGQEWNAWSTDGGSPAEHVTVLPFTRVMAGPVDYTPGVFNFSNPVYPQTRVHATLANQLALFVVLYSPLQMACDLPENYMLHPEEFEFVKAVPCDWEQSRMLDGKIGDFIVMARQERGGADWYVGAVTDENSRDITLALDFLEPERTYEMKLYGDAAEADWENAPYATQIYTRSVSAQDSVAIHMGAGGGCAIQFKAL